MQINLKSLIGRLNTATRNALEAAAGLCVSRSHYDVEIEHFLAKLSDSEDADFARIARRFSLDAAKLNAQLARTLDGLKTGNARTPAFSPSLLRMLQQAWSIASLDFGGSEIRGGHALLALVSDDELSRQMRDGAPELLKISAEQFRAEFDAIVDGSKEGDESSPALEPQARTGKTPNLDQFTVDLTENARQGKIDPVLGRDAEIRQIVDILMRRRQNNPILTGEAGVGKTAVVEGFALRVSEGDVPPPLRNVSVRSLDLALLQAGAGVKGEFENRLKGLIEEVKRSPIPIILFIDEAHTLIGAGGTAGQGDAANLIKPALARGEMRTIAATTWSEYKKYFEKDAALARRFQVVKVEEPSEVQCMVMLRGIVPMLEKHHSVRILDEAVASAVHLSNRYMVGRQLPDKAVSVLDTACARLSLAQSATPAAIEDTLRQLSDVEVQTRVLSRETSAGADHAERLALLAEQKSSLESQLATLQERWTQEANLVTSLRELRSALEEGGHADGERAQRVEESARLSSELDRLQGERPLLRVCVDRQTVSEVISAWTGIPAGKMLKDEVNVVLELENHLGRRVVGQSDALAAISHRIRTSRANLDDPSRPVGVFLLVGPSGVGKTETALALSDLLYGGERNLITINMSEFQEPHTVSSLKGSPPGYVGYGEGGVLTEAVRRRPHAVVLLDEIEKAHPDVMELFYQVFDKGVMEDGEGREIDFKNTILILTTNAGSDTIMRLCADPETMPDSQGLASALKDELNKIFKPAFLGRTIITPYFPLGDEALRSIISLKLAKIQKRLAENHKIALTWDDALLDTVAARCTEVESGARNVDNILTNTLLPDLSRRLLAALAAGEKPSAYRVGVAPDGAFTYA